GTKDSQYILKSLNRRTPALKKAIAHYNDLCLRLRDILDDLGLDYPLPEPIDGQLTKLKDGISGLAASVLEDVWLTGPPVASHRWLTDAKVRSGIRAMHILDRCGEEDSRLDRESLHLLHWVR
ncbi:hypothetical protein BKA62DRAFT_597194, partial [Auriculariales sp. MPI-PUGE-AT-0066]